MIGALSSHGGVTGGDVLQADGSSDVACANFFDLFTLVGVHLEQYNKTLALLFDGVQRGVTGVNHTGVNAEEGQVATNGSVAILNARAENGSSSEA